MAAVDGVDFDAEGFRAGILLAMNMGLPVDENDRPLFVFPQTIENDTPADDEDVPFDPEARPTVGEPVTDPIRVPCAIEYLDAEGKVVEFGIIRPSKVKLTFLGPEYDQVVGFSFVMIGGERYFYSKTETPLAMFSAAVWIVHCRAEDDL